MFNSSKELLNNARQGGFCIPQFNINNLEWTKIILETTNKLNCPVILGVSEGAIKYMGGYNTVVSLIKGLIKDLGITIPVILHLDHGSSVESCIKAIDSGFSSIMIDASSYDIDQNIAITREVVAYAHPKGITVEGELGHIGGHEDGRDKNIIYVDINEAIRYVNETNVDTLAPAIGSKHGMYGGEPQLNIELLKELKTKINIPLVLHGGSGISDEQLKEVIVNGISKININTELQVAWAKQVRTFLLQDKEVYDPRKIIESGKQAIVDVITNKVKIFMNK